MRTMPATELRVSLFETLKRVGYEREPVVIERRGRPIAVLVPPDAVDASTEQMKRTGRRRPALDPKAVADLCTRHRIKTLYLFGSVLTDRFDDESDVDVMFEPEEGAPPDLFVEMNVADELAELFGRPVDLVSRGAVDSMSNQFRRRAILDGARIIYGR